ncbi:Putative cytoplasmic protein clustered with trehalase [Olavius sp. associated proteobacterium Delta 1]|nr:Putative cytoplasmic protein clustered with trehalase [Olavius sp. associated proteobacterium Delta 1]
METISISEARRLALARAGLLKPEWTGLPKRATDRTLRARKAAHRIIRRFGYLQLDTVSIAGARSHAIVLLSRLDGFDHELAEELLRPNEPLFEYWGHEASWIPMELYPVFEFRRKAFCSHPWWGDLIGQHPQVAENLRRRIRDEGPIRSLDMEGSGSNGWWDLKLVKRVATALWSAGELAIRERRNFQRIYDLTEHVIPERWRQKSVPESQAIEQLLVQALKGHGWASSGTLSQTWRLTNQKKSIAAALNRLVDKDRIVPCILIGEDKKKRPGWIRPNGLELAARLKRVRPRADKGVLLSPFDPVLWDRRRVQQLFAFDQVLEIFKPALKRKYGYYCLPVLAGDRLVARVDLKADWKAKKLNVLSVLLEEANLTGKAKSKALEALRTALDRYAGALKLKLAGRKLY